MIFDVCLQAQGAFLLTHHEQQLWTHRPSTAAQVSVPEAAAKQADIWPLVSIPSVWLQMQNFLCLRATTLVQQHVSNN
jgi:hypothetical protein